jgi:hypothetical protein
MKDVLVSEKYGFGREVSTATATFKLTYSVFKCIKQDMHVGGIICDLAKTFDSANNDILLAKLYFCGIQEVYADCFQTYLKKQETEI